MQAQFELRLLRLTGFTVSFAHEQRTTLSEKFVGNLPLLPFSVTINNIEKRRGLKEDYRRSREATQLQSNLYYVVTHGEWQGDRSIHVDL